MVRWKIVTNLTLVLEVQFVTPRYTALLITIAVVALYRLAIR
jgi:hypothetical protein